MEENIPLQAIPYYWRNRLTILKKIADKKATPDGRKEYTEYQRKYHQKYKRKHQYNRPKVTRKNYVVTTRNNSITVSSDPTRERINSTTSEKKTVITEIPQDFVIPSSSWN